MRIDPLAVFSHTISSLVLRVVLAWIVATVGTVTPGVIGHGLGSLAGFLWLLLLFPFYLLVIALASGWWSFVAIPLLLTLVWRGVLFLREDKPASELLWIFLLACLISLRTGGDDWPIVVWIASGVIALLIHHERCQTAASRE